MPPPPLGGVLGGSAFSLVFCWVVLLGLLLLWVVYWVDLLSPLSSVGWCCLASSSFGWCTGWICFLPCLLLGGAALPPPPLGGVLGGSAFSLVFCWVVLVGLLLLWVVYWVDLLSPLSSVGWCWLASSSSFGWCTGWICFLPCLLLGGAALPPPPLGGVLGGYAFSLVFCWVVLVGLLLISVVYWVDLLSPLSSVGWCCFASSSFGWCTGWICFLPCLLLGGAALPPPPLWICFLPCLLLGGAGWPPPPLGGVLGGSAFSLVFCWVVLLCLLLLWVVYWVDLLSPLSSVGWCCFASSSFGWCTGWICFLPCLLLGGAAWPPPPLGGVLGGSAFSLVFCWVVLVGLLLLWVVYWVDLLSPLSSVGWCCFASSSFGWCTGWICILPCLLLGGAALPPPPLGGVLGGSAFSLVFCWVVLLCLLLLWVVYWVDLLSPLSSVGWCCFASSSFGWCTGWICFLPCLLLGGAALPPPPLGGVLGGSAFSLVFCWVVLLCLLLLWVVYWVDLLSPCLLLGGAALPPPPLGGVLGGSAFSLVFCWVVLLCLLLLLWVVYWVDQLSPLSSVGWCCFASSSFGWCTGWICFLPCLLLGGAALPPPPLGGVLGGSAFSLVFCWVVLLCLLLLWVVYWVDLLSPLSSVGWCCFASSSFGWCTEWICFLPCLCWVVLLCLLLLWVVYWVDLLSPLSSVGWCCCAS